MTPEKSETIQDIFEDIFRRCRVPQEQRKEYESRIAKALWLDRVEVERIMKEGEDS